MDLTTLEVYLECCQSKEWCFLEVPSLVCYTSLCLRVLRYSLYKVNTINASLFSTNIAHRSKFQLKREASCPLP
jgi:hypothetical protein